MQPEAPRHRLRPAQVLDISFNQICRIEGLQDSGLCALRELYLANNKISEIEGLGALPSLRLLELGSNKIRTMRNLQARDRRPGPRGGWWTGAAAV